MGEEAETTAAMHNLQRNIQHLKGEQSVLSWTKAHGLSQSTISRVLNGAQDITTTQLQRIADAVGLQAWQLIAPRLGEGMLEVRSSNAGQHIVVPINTSPRPMRQVSSPYSSKRAKESGRAE